MTEYLSPGVHVEEVSNRVPTIDGVKTSTAAFVGHFEKGPIDEAVRLPSMTVFEDVFGGVSAHRQASFAVDLFFQNGGSDAYAVRIADTSTFEEKNSEALSLIGNRETKSGMYALDAVDHFNLLVLPDSPLLADFEASQVFSAATAYCEERRAFCILDVPQKTERRRTANQVKKWLNDFGYLRERNAAIYFPRVLVQDPRNSGEAIAVGPSGAIAGLYARTDVGRGVWKAPAGMGATLLGVQGLEHTITDKDIGRLNPLAVNCLKEPRCKECVVWGARTFAGTNQQGDERNYVSVRRLALFIEESLSNGLGWVVFEPNDKPLWARIRETIDTFMLELFLRGALQGLKTDEAHFVKCDSETTAQSDRTNGVVNVWVGFAPLRPAEFIVLHVQQKTKEAAVAK